MRIQNGDPSNHHIVHIIQNHHPQQASSVPSQITHAGSSLVAKASVAAISSATRKANASSDGGAPAETAVIQLEKFNMFR